MNLINRYLRQEVAYSILFVMIALMAMFSFFDLIRELDSIGKGNYGITSALIYVVMSAPGHVYDVVPVAVLIGTMHALGQLSRHSELTVLRVSGVSIPRLTKSLLGVGLIFALLTFIVGEIITPLSEKSAQRMRLQATDSVIAQDFNSGLWVKDGTSFVNINDVRADASLLNVNIYEFDDSFRLNTITQAENGHYDGDIWKLAKVRQTWFDKETINSVYLPDALWQSLIRPELMSVLLVQPEKMSMVGLYSYINHLSKNKQKTARHQIAFLAKIIYPLACLVMIILALPFGFLQQRAGGASLKIFAGIMLGVVYQVLNRVFSHLGLLNDWSPITSAVTPTLLFLIAGITMLWWTEKN